MFSYASGTAVNRGGEEFLHIRLGATGHVVHGPYDHIRPGVFRVDFTLALAEDPQGDPGEHVATLDIAAYRGSAVLVSQRVTRGDLSADLRTFSLDIINREFRSLEYRVESLGKAELLIGKPRLVRLGDVTAPQPEADPNAAGNDPVEVQRQARVVLRQLRPQRAKGHDKVRLGNEGDGGYVCLDDFRPGDTALSLGINDDISWDLDAADRGLTIHQFDHTVDDPAPHDERMVFNKKMIAAYSSDTTSSLSDLIRKHDRGEARPNLMLKMDIEGAEWESLDDTSVGELARFSQICCELHGFEHLGDVERRRQMHRCLSKIAESFVVVHVHGNSCGGLANVANLMIPRCLEFTFVNKSLYNTEDTDELFPGPLDTSCDAYQPDLYLGNFRF